MWLPWLEADQIAGLKHSGAAYEMVQKASQRSVRADMSDQNNRHNTKTFALALLSCGEPNSYAGNVQAKIREAMGTERRNQPLAAARSLAAYAVSYMLTRRARVDRHVVAWFRKMVAYEFQGWGTLDDIARLRPNNWGAMAGASMCALRLALDEPPNAARFAQFVATGSSSFRFDHSGRPLNSRQRWTTEAPGMQPAINPKGARKWGKNLDGCIPDDQRRIDGDLDHDQYWEWPPHRTNYAWECLQGLVAWCELLYQAGYDSYRLGDSAILRATEWLYRINSYPAEGDDTWIPHIIHLRYGNKKWLAPQTPARAGKIMGFSDWTHAAT